MKRFLSNILLFITILLFLAFGFDYAICQGLLSMEDYRFQDYKAMLDGGMNNDILIMGNSRGKSHFDTYIIDSLSHKESFDIGVGGYPINVQLMKYRIYRKHNHKPDIIIQNIDYLTMYEYKDVRHQHQSEQFFPLFYDRAGRKELKSMGYGFLELYIPLYRMFGYQMVIKNGLLEFMHIKHYVSRPAYKGFRPEYGDWDGTELAKMERHKIEISDSAKQLLEEFLSSCNRDSIEVVLVNSPMYFKALDKLEGYNYTQDYFKSLAYKYKCYFLDYTENYEICHDSCNFCVAVHMNPEATKKFTKQLCFDLDSLGLM